MQDILDRARAAVEFLRDPQQSWIQGCERAANLMESTLNEENIGILSDQQGVLKRRGMRQEDEYFHVDTLINLRTIMMYMLHQIAICGETKRLRWRNVAFIIEDGALRGEQLTTQE